VVKEVPERLFLMSEKKLRQKLGKSLPGLHSSPLS